MSDSSLAQIKFSGTADGHSLDTLKEHIISMADQGYIDALGRSENPPTPAEVREDIEAAPAAQVGQAVVAAVEAVADAEQADAVQDPAAAQAQAAVPRVSRLYRMLYTNALDKAARFAVTHCLTGVAKESLPHPPPHTYAELVRYLDRVTTPERYRSELIQRVDLMSFTPLAAYARAMYYLDQLGDHPDAATTVGNAFMKVLLRDGIPTSVNPVEFRAGTVRALIDIMRNDADGELRRRAMGVSQGIAVKVAAPTTKASSSTPVVAAAAVTPTNTATATTAANGTGRRRRRRNRDNLSSDEVQQRIANINANRARDEKALAGYQAQLQGFRQG
ncbi:hypothetical protein GQ42DRAFT_7399 [Ramicandelaber brevisporus]|nr:hypothetical protein GQ42DRAFT_7399 [Ramicandelaber brevisporus]